MSADGVRGAESESVSLQVAKRFLRRMELFETLRSKVRSSQSPLPL
jgi:hypothetical protein